MSLPKEWKQSSLVGAKKIKEVIGGRAGEYMFVRGDAIIEEAISKAFGRVKKQTNLSSEDKWNPADIWMVRKSMKTKIAEKLKTEGTIDCLNNYLQELNVSKDMIGFSLKKIGGTTTLKLINGDTQAERKKKESAKFVQ